LKTQHALASGDYIISGTARFKYQIPHASPILSGITSEYSKRGLIFYGSYSIIPSGAKLISASPTVPSSCHLIGIFSVSDIINGI
jgi:hypothetical protein